MHKKMSANRAQEKRQAKEAEHRQAWAHYQSGVHSVGLFRYVHLGLWYFLRAIGLYKRGILNALDIRIKEHTVKLSRLPRQFDGYRILHISDLHIGGIPGLTERICTLLETISADACVFTGDYGFAFYDPPEKLVRHMRAIIRSIRVNDGMFGVLGNHDSSDLLPVLEELGVKILMNQTAAIRRGMAQLWFIGLDDCHHFQAHDLDYALQEANILSGECKIFLIHSPEFIPQASEAGMDFYLCGHCHGGQIRVPALGALINNARCKRTYTDGHWRYNRMAGFTHRGTGTSCVPVRFNCPPEMVVHTLRCGEN